jgi:hypothetical protein
MRKDAPPVGRHALPTKQEKALGALDETLCQLEETLGESRKTRDQNEKTLF